jgi:amino acid transporter
VKNGRGEFPCIGYFGLKLKNQTMAALKQEIRKFGTAPVFFTAISTILGAIMFLRFGFAVGTVGFLGTIAIILIGHAVTIPTAMAIAEIATNQKVEGGGEYFIISRSFGLVIGSTIGIALYLSQGISVAFYIMAFAEAFTPLFSFFKTNFDLPGWLIWILDQKQTVGIPALLVLTYIMLTKGADLGVKALYIVVATLAISLVAFFAGETAYSKTHDFDPIATVYNTEMGRDSVLVKLNPAPTPDTAAASNGEPALEPKRSDSTPVNPLLPIGFFTVFAIIFPAFTGMTAGVGLSGDLRDPGKSLPLGTMAGTLTGMVIYVFIAWKLAVSASPQDLADTSTLVMADIAFQGWWLIPLGLAAATISSALGSIMVAPRTLQAIARDRIFPTPRINAWLSMGKGKSDEPFNASVVTILIAAAFILMGALDVVAQIISMFFMVTYGSLCLISFLNHFAADPSYRPSFKSRWYISLFGALACFGLMFFMNGVYAVVAIFMMIGLYFLISYYNKDKKSVALIFQGVIFQLSRQTQVFLQKADKEKSRSWRPSAVAISENSFTRLGVFDLLRWIAHKYGFGTFIHLIKGYLSRQTNHEAQACKDRLIKMAEASDSNIYVDSLISPSYTSSIAQVIQLPGMAGTENNLLLFEFSRVNPGNLPDIVDNYTLIRAVDFDVVILASSERGFGLKKQIHVWLTAADFENANHMVLLANIIASHRDWKHGEIRVFAVYPEENMEMDTRRLLEMTESGELPISSKNISFIKQRSDTDLRTIIRDKSQDADLSIIGFRSEAVKHSGKAVFENYELNGNILFVNAAKRDEG